MPAPTSSPPATPQNRAQRRHPELARRRYVSPAEAADYLGVTTRTIRQMVSDGRLTAYRNGPKLVRLDLNEIDANMVPFGGGI